MTTVATLIPFRVIELLLEIVLEAMRGQTPEQRAQMWQWYIEDMKWWRALLDDDPVVPVPTSVPIPKGPTGSKP